MDEVDEIKQRLDVVEVVGSYLQLKPAGRNFKGLSPFKQEKTPSFMVSPEKGIWHDFSSGQGGDIFTFVQIMEGVEFREALEILAKRAGVELKSRRGQVSKDNKSRLYESARLAVSYYHTTLAKNARVLEYLKSDRGLSRDTIKVFQLGYAPDSWEALTKFLTKRGFKPEELLAAGLVGRKQASKSVYDLFRGRVLFPIFDVQGRAIGFSGRILGEATNVAKYINTPQTAIYNKSTAIFGLAQAKETIRRLDEVIVVEGNMDVVGLYNARVENVVAASGTALTAAQLKIISRLTKNIKLAFDNDEAGIAATGRAIEVAASLDVRLSVITYDSGDVKDPDELVRKDKKAWAKAVKEAKYAVDYLFDEAESRFDLTSALGKKQASDLLLPLIKILRDDVERDHYIKRLARRLIVSEESIHAKLTKTTGLAIHSSTLTPTQKPKMIAQPVLSKQIVIENQLLEIFLAFAFAREALADIDLKDISTANQPIFKMLQKNPQASLEKIANALKKSGNDVKIHALRGEEEYSRESEHDIRLEAYTQVHRLQKYNRELNKRRLARQIAEAEAAGNKTEVTKLLTKYQVLIQEE